MRIDPAAIHLLEHDQLTSSTRQSLPRRALGPGTLVLLILLRIYVVVAIPIVVYAFVQAVKSPR